MMDLITFGRLDPWACEEEDDIELRFVFVGKWQHFFDGRPTWSETRWVFDRKDWSVVFLEILDPAAMEWICATRDEVSSVDRDLRESDAQFLDDLDEWGLTHSDELPDWACTRAEFEARCERVTRERLAEGKLRFAVRLLLPGGRDIWTVAIRFARPH